MAATGYTPISLYYSSTAASVPVNTNLVNGELAINITDGKLYYKDNSGVVKLLASNSGASGDVVGPASSTNTAIATFDGTTGKLIKNNSSALIDSSGNFLLGTSTSFTSTNVSGALKMDGYGIYPYIGAVGTTNTAVPTGFTYQNSTSYAGDNGATGSTLIGVFSSTKLSNSGAGGSNAIAAQGGNFQLSISNVGSAGRISGTGLAGAAVRGISTDLSTDTSNSLIGVSGNASHGITAGAGIVSGVAIAGQFSASNLNGTVTTLEAIRGGVSIANTTTSLSSSSSTAAGVRSIMTVGSTSGGPGTVTSLYGFLTQGPTIAATGTVTNYYGVYLDTASVTGTLTNRYGIYQVDPAGYNYFGANTGIGATAPAQKLQIGIGGSDDFIQFGATGSGYVIGRENATGEYLFNATQASPYNVFKWQQSGTERMRLSANGYFGVGINAPTTMLQTAGSSSVAAFKTPNIVEVATVSATAATGTINYDCTTQSVVYYTTNASGNWTINFRGSSGTSLNTVMATGESMSFSFLATQGSTAYYNSAVQVDGTTSGVTTKWQGGSAPTSGNASSIDSYTYVIIKTGSATFTVLATQTKFA